MGTGILIVVFPLLALHFTQSSLAISLVVALTQAPGIIFGLPFGTMADRLNRRRVLLVVQVLRFTVLAAFGIAVLTGNYSLGTIYAVVFVLGALTLAFEITVTACLPSIVDESLLARANAHMLNAELTSENLLGQSLGGIALAITPSLPFLAEAGTIAVSAGLLRRAVPDSTPTAPEITAWRDLGRGIRWVASNAALRIQIITLAGLVLAEGMVFGILALYAKNTLGLSNAGYGILLAVATLGTVIGGAIAARLNDRASSLKTIVVATAVMACGYPILAFTQSAFIAAGALMLEQGGVILASTASRTIRQRIVPHEMQGRVASAGTTVLLSCAPIGAVLGGLIAEATSLHVTFFAAAAVDVLVLVFLGPRLRRVASSEQPGLASVSGSTVVAAAPPASTFDGSERSGTVLTEDPATA
jgi:MFS family permease